MLVDLLYRALTRQLPSTLALLMFVCVCVRDHMSLLLINLVLSTHVS